MQIREFLDNVCNQIKFKEIREDVRQELKSHIEEVKECYIETGIEEKVAEEKAIKQMGDAGNIGKNLNRIHSPKLDWKLLLIVGILLCFGILVLLVRVNNGLDGYVGSGNIGKYISFLSLGIILGTIIYFLDYQSLRRYSNILYVAATGIIVYAMIFGRMVNGIPYIYITNFISVMPAIVVLPLYIIAFVGFINNLDRKSKLQELISKHFKIKINVNLIKIILLSVISLIALAIIPSIASVGILGLTYMIIATVKILQMKENKFKNIIKLWGSVVIIGITLLMFVLGVSPFRWNRLQVAINPESDPQGGGWIAINREKIISSAKILGEAENMSDAIDLFDEGTDGAFISLLAHFGWSASIGVVIVIIALSVKLIMNAIKIKDNYGKFLVIGISSMFILQSIFNILINLNLWIDFSLNLPFVSYGGANLVINIMSLALILSIYRRKDIIVLKNNISSEKILEN